MLRGQESLRAKALENKGLKYESEKKYSLSLNGYPYDKEPETCSSHLLI
jgi:hypothetical protein